MYLLGLLHSHFQLQLLSFYSHGSFHIALSFGNWINFLGRLVCTGKKGFYQPEWKQCNGCKVRAHYGIFLLKYVYHKVFDKKTKCHNGLETRTCLICNARVITAYIFRQFLRWFLPFRALALHAFFHFHNLSFVHVTVKARIENVILRCIFNHNNIFLGEMLPRECSVCDK